MFLVRIFSWRKFDLKNKIQDMDDFELPPSKYSKDLMTSCDKLEASLKRLEEIGMRDKKLI